MSNYKHRTLRIKNVSCDDCVSKVVSAIEPLEGVVSVNVHPGKSTIEVRYDLEKIKLEGITDSLRTLGFPLEDSLVERFKNTFINFTEENEIANLEAEPMPCCSYSDEYLREEERRHESGT